MKWNRYIAQTGFAKTFRRVLSGVKSSEIFALALGSLREKKALNTRFTRLLTYLLSLFFFLYTKQTGCRSRIRPQTPQTRRAMGRSKSQSGRRVEESPREEKGRGVQTRRKVRQGVRVPRERFDSLKKRSQSERRLLRRTGAKVDLCHAIERFERHAPEDEAHFTVVAFETNSQRRLHEGEQSDGERFEKG
jgi:hypothetical protein